MANLYHTSGVIDELRRLPIVDVPLPPSEDGWQQLFPRVYAALVGSSAENVSVEESPQPHFNAEARNEILRQAIGFIQFLQDNDSYVIAHHTDADGISSTLLLVDLIAQLKGVSVVDVRENIKFISINNGNRDFEAQQLALLDECAGSFESIIFVDLAPRNITQLIKLATQFKLANIDHHGSLPGLPFTAQLNPSTIPSVSKDVRQQMSTSYLFSLLGLLGLQESDLTWLMQLGSKGDGSTLYDLEISHNPEVEEPEKIAQLQQLAQTEVFAKFINIIGAVEQYNQPVLERDQYINQLLDLFLSFDLESPDAAIQIEAAVRADPRFKERFNAIGSALFETTTFLLVTDDIVDQRAKAKATSEGEYQPEILAVRSEENRVAAVLAGETFTVLLHQIDPMEHAKGNVIVGNLIKPHLAGQEMKPGSKPTTALLFEEKKPGVYEFALYSTDGRLINSETFSVKEILAQANRGGFTHGAGGHDRRGGGDIATQRLEAALTYMVSKVLVFLRTEEIIAAYIADLKDDEKPDAQKRKQLFEVIKTNITPLSLQQAQELVALAIQKQVASVFPAAV